MIKALGLNLEIVYVERQEGKNETLGRCSTRVMMVFGDDAEHLTGVELPLGVEVDAEGRITKISEEAFRAFQTIREDPVFIEWALHAFSKHFFPDSPTELSLEATERLCKIYPTRPKGVPMPPKPKVRFIKEGEES